MMYKKILVTGCGGDIGMSVGRILKEILPDATIVGSEISSDHPGQFVYDSCIELPRVDAPDYLTRLKNAVREHAIECIIPMSVPEILYFNKAGVRDVDGVPLIAPNKMALDVGQDKLMTNEFLQKHTLPYPWTRLVKDGPPPELPCIIKSRFGWGSRGVFLVDKDSVEYFSRTQPSDIWQEHLLPDEEEYTCGVYGTAGGDIRSIIMRRKLGGGHTVSGEVVDNTPIREVVEKFAHHLKLRGSINFQLRLTKKGPMIFEINPRFSSTVMFRHMLGFKDVLWSLEENAGHVASTYTPPKIGTKFYKGNTEYIV